VGKLLNKATLRWAVMVALLGAIVVLIVRKVAASWQELSRYDFQLNWPLAAVAVVLGAGYYFANSQAWRYALHRSGGRVSVLGAYRLYAISLFGRYVPGKAWLALIRMELAARQGISRTATVIAVLYENGLQLTTGVAFAAIVGAGLFVKGTQTGLAAIVVAGLCAATLAPPIFYRILNLLLKITGREPFDRKDQLRFGHLARMIVFFVFVWAFGGTSLYVLAVALDAGLKASLLHMVVIFTISQVLGFVAFFAPGGLGVREATQYLLLVQITSVEQAIILPALSRLVMIAAELLQAGVLEALVRQPGRRPAGGPPDLHARPNSDE
jgi:uncharacterized membrane protein YbhN (UPF0104 family)